MRSFDNYDKFVENSVHGIFFQSLAFGEFQEKIPYRGKSWALVTTGKTRSFDKLRMTGLAASSCLVIKQKLPLGFCWLWVPYGPLGYSEEIFEDLADIAKEERAIFARIEPPQDWQEEYTKKLKTHWKVNPAFNRYTPEHTITLDIDKSEEEILAQMKPKGRYNIRVAERHGVIVKKWDGDLWELKEFYRILQKTAARDKFGIHPMEFYETLLNTLPKDMVSLFLANDNDTIIAGIIVVFYKDTATYYYGASDSAYRNLMAPYLLQWEAIKEAKKRGLRFYDFLGTAPANVKSHPWLGITKFKEQFGGRRLDFPQAFDVVYQPLLYVLIKLKNAAHA